VWRRINHALIYDPLFYRNNYMIIFPQKATQKNKLLKSNSTKFQENKFKAYTL